MTNNISILMALMIAFVSIVACDQQDEIITDEIKTEVAEEEPTASKYDEKHPYGGWFCPDNLGGFPPMDIQNLGELNVISNRLPTKEETNNGTSLIHVDIEKYPDARPLDIDLPRLAWSYSGHIERNELVIVIQAIVVGEDTVVGFRYPTGGNGSAWLAEVTFLSDQEVDEIGSTPFVHLTSEVNASKEEIWKAFTGTAFAQKLGERFDQKEFFESEWTADSKAHLNYDADGKKGIGIVFNFWGNVYMQIDYDFNGFHFSEKLLIMENAEEGTTEIQLVSGPYPDDFEAQQVNWTNWPDEVKELSEGS